MMQITNLQLKSHVDKYKEFKMETLNSDMTLQKLVNRAIHLYLTDSTIQKTIDAPSPITDNKNIS